MNDQQVVFRRIKGRIVAIKKRVEKTNGPTLVAAGVGVSAGAGYVGAKVATTGAKMAKAHFDKATHYAKVGKVNFDLLGKVKPDAIKDGFQAAQKGGSILYGSNVLAKRVATSGKLFGISLAGVGVGKIIDKALPQKKGEQNSAARDVATNAVGLTVAFAGNSIWKKTLKKHFTNFSFRGVNFASRNAKATSQMVFKGIL
jgi:hypothetical protein